MSIYLLMIVSALMGACNSSGEKDAASVHTEHSTTDKSTEGEHIESPTTANNSAASPGMGGSVNTHAAAADTTEYIEE